MTLMAVLLPLGGCEACRRTERSRLEIQGHRGCRGLRPENTLAAFEHAIELGVDVIELDLGMSKDGVLVVTHDPEINEVICTGAGRLPSRVLRELTWRQLATLDCGARKNPRYPQQVPVPGQKMPRLEQVLDLLRAHPQLGANVEIKTSPEQRQLTHPPQRFAAALVKLLRQRRLEGRVVIQSFDPEALVAVARLDPSRRLTLAALADRRAEIEPMLRATRATILSPRYTELGAQEVRSLQRRGLRVIPWTVNGAEAMRRLLAWGVDGIITDRPDRLLELAGRRRR